MVTCKTSNMIALDASCSYSNEDATKECFVPKLTKKHLEDDGLGIFEAEKYFKGVTDVHHQINQSRDKHEDQPCALPKLKAMSSARSESSWNSRRGLLVSNGTNHRKKISFKSLLASIGCNCNDKDSIKIKEFKQPVKGGGGLNPSTADAKHFRIPKLPEVDREHIAKGEILEVFRNGGQDDTGSDASSDLFEIENFSANEDYNSFLARQATENNEYALSEASVEWSVVTASVADFPKTIFIAKESGRSWSDVEERETDEDDVEERETENNPSLRIGKGEKCERGGRRKRVAQFSHPQDTSYNTTSHHEATSPLVSNDPSCFIQIVNTSPINFFLAKTEMSNMD
ncbi:putative protein PHYTOCHROME KINASE SUBSTRATE [Helianthus annuus]|nr:putative protein PHYTOCHROME KINASE SUBSTRATE [Helianthus annuus]KAJ0896173.1 putative protein PHYTOCHROME KINASE SUBSTRATE [Helianthus annuus]KAJ0900181.1 putative protein PHYTOCHROME KINASE SUBSTRATE [Helianthus annuus]